MKPPRHPLNMNRPYRVQCCVYCGAEFPTQTGNAQYCSFAHQMAEWRAVKMLEGTYGYVGGQFARLVRP